MHNDMEQYKKTFDAVHVSERTRTEVMNMMNHEKTTRRQSGRAMIAVVVAVILALSLTAYAVAELKGFARTGDMSNREIVRMLEAASHGKGGALIDADGTVQILDAAGNVTAEMTEEEYAQYERDRLEQMKQEAQAMTDLIDLETRELSPWGIEELPVIDGKIEDFAMSNGYMVVLTTPEGTAFDLNKGQTVTIRMESNDACYIEFGMYKDGTMISDPTFKNRSHDHTFTIPEDGNYSFSLMYFSAAASNFTDCELIVE